MGNIDQTRPKTCGVDTMVTPTAARMIRPSPAQLKGFVYRENRVPFYQRLFQSHDGKRQWWKTSRSPYILYPYYTMLVGSFTYAVYGMTRMVFGHKTLW